MEYVAQYVEMQFQLEHNNVMMATTLTVMDVTLIVQLEIITVVQQQLHILTPIQNYVLLLVRLVIMLILHYSHVSLATTLVAHALLPLLVILVLLQATES